jgi:asparagine synthase (glutamine-hydrolysing)
LTHLEPYSVPCYTFGDSYRDTRDVIVARKVAALCQQSHAVIKVDADYLRHFGEYAERSVYLTEGGVDVSRSSDLYLSEKAREIASVKVVGTYGSEILRSIVTFKWVRPTTGIFHPDLMPHFELAGATYAEVRKAHPVTFAAFRQSPWHHSGVLSLEQSQLTVRSPYLDNDVVRTVFQAPATGASDPDIRLRLVQDGDAQLARVRTDIGVGGTSNALVSRWFRTLQWVTNRAEYAYDYGMPQALAKIDRTLAPLHPERLVLGRHKFLHYRIWYRDVLANYVKEMLLDRRTLARPYLHAPGIQSMVQHHTDGRKNYTTEIHKVLTLELIHRLFVD